MFEKVSHSKKQFLLAIALFFGAILVVGMLAGCSSSDEESESKTQEPAATEQDNANEAEEAANLEGEELNIYCGAGMTDPFQIIADKFQDETGCVVNVTFANAAQIQTQIETTEEGDFFIAGSTDELPRVESYVDSSVDLVKHIPVIAVPEGNPKNVQELDDFIYLDHILVGDPESTAIGKVAKKALNEKGIWDTLTGDGVLTMTTTAPQIATALAAQEADAGIVWKENTEVEGVELVDTTDLDSLIKTIPAAKLTSAHDSPAVEEFNKFLETDEVFDIWADYGYEKA